jgi:hypothetical protein
MGLLDLNAERAVVVQRLNRAGIPLTAWLLLPEEQGYWFNVDNAAQAAARYAEFRAWTLRHNLQWAGVGIDIEPAMADMRMLMTGDFGALLPRLLGRLADKQRIERARQAYLALISRMRSDGYAVESYQFPFILDERQAGSTLLQRLFGILDVPTDREVLMLYSSILPDFGPGIMGSYGPDAQGIGVGSTGGGVELEGAAGLAHLGAGRPRPEAGATLERSHLHLQPGRVCPAGLPGAAARARLDRAGRAAASPGAAG